MWFVLDSSLDACTTALIHEGAVQALRQEIIGKGHAERLPLLLEDMLAGIDTAQIRHIAVCVGPGSFTGLRVALAAARAFGLAWQIPVCGASSLDAVAHAAQNLFEGPLLIAHDAKRGQVFARTYSCDALPEPTALAPAAAAALAKAAGCSVAGSGARLLRAHCPDLHVIDSAIYPEPLSLIATAHLLDSPLYVRAPDARTLAERAAL